MTWLKRLADRVILRPSTHPIDSGELLRKTIPVSDGNLEAWTTRHGDRNDQRKVLLIKFPGNAGRAERGTANPIHLWGAVSGDVWTINPFGYGGSDGRATLQRYEEMVDAVYDTVRPQFPDHRLVVYGRSLGSLSALAMAAKYPVDGLFLWDPVPIHQLVATRPRYAWLSLGFSRVVAMQIPTALDTVRNAKRCRCPCLVVSSEKDRLVPPSYQAQVIDNYWGPKQVFVIPNAGHDSSIPAEMEYEYRRDVGWLCRKVFGDFQG